MTNEEAIKNIKEHCYFANLMPQVKEALDMAIKVLEQEPCNDCISREQAIKQCFGMSSLLIANSLRKLPSVQPKPKTMQAQENQEEFIFETIRPYCEDVLQMKINKEELKQILLNGIQKLKSGIDK